MEKFIFILSARWDNIDARSHATVQSALNYSVMLCDGYTIHTVRDGSLQCVHVLKWDYYATELWRRLCDDNEYF